MSTGTSSKVPSTMDSTKQCLVSMFINELFGSMFMLFFVCAGYEILYLRADSIVAFGAVAGLSYLGASAAFLKHNGGFFNIATMIPFHFERLLRGKFKNARAFILIILVSLAANIIGPALAGLLLFLIFGFDSSLGAASIGEDYAEWNAFFMLTIAVTVLVIAHNTTLSSSETKGFTIWDSSMTLAGVYGLLSILSVSVTGGVLDPMRWLIPAAYSAEWHSAWVYVCGILAGMVVGFLIHYAASHMHKDKRKSNFWGL